jgi:hypothetical protein
MNKLVEEAPYHPGYEDAVVSPAPKYKGVDPAKMIWKTKPLSDEEIYSLLDKCIEYTDDHDQAEFMYKKFARAIEERHGIK